LFFVGARSALPGMQSTMKFSFATPEFDCLFIRP